MWAEPVWKRIRGGKTISLRMFSHICDTAVCELPFSPHARTQSWRHTRVDFPGAWTCGAIIPMPHRCNNKGAGLEDSQLFEIPASRNSNKASRHVFQYTHIHTLLHVDILKILHRPEMLSKLLSCWNILHLYSQSSHLFMEGEAHTPNPGSHGLPRGCAIWPPYMDMYFQIRAENPESDLGREPKKP